MKTILLMLLLGLVLVLTGCDDSDSESGPWGKTCDSTNYTTVCTDAGECEFDSLGAEKGVCVVRTKCEDSTTCGGRDCTEDRLDGEKYCGVVDVPFGVNAPTFPNGEINVAYPEQTISVVGNSGAHYFICPEPCGLPDGMTMSESGVVSGTPTVIGEFAFTVVAVNGGKDATAYYNATKIVKTYQLSVTKRGYVDPCTDNPCKDTNKTTCTDTDKDEVAECSCDSGYHADGESCVSSTKEVPCKDLATVPTNGEQVTANVTVTWDETNGWPEAAECAWVCVDGFNRVGDVCVVDPCYGENPCTDPNKTVCTDEDQDGVAECGCDDGYYLDGDVCTQYIDPCAPTNPCTDPNKTVCTDENKDSVAECGCDFGYELDGDTCKEIVVEATLFFSEYVEGSSNNKVLELYNPLSSSVDLSTYSIALASNGNDWGDSDLQLEGTLSGQKTYVICNSSVAEELKPKCDLLTGSGVGFNGNDAVGLKHNGALIDIIGVPTSDIDEAVAGVAAATKNHTLTRKSSIKGGTTDWALSAGTNETDSQWIVKDIDDFSDLGMHGDVVSCSEGETQSIACGLNGNGSQAQVCTASSWVNDGNCVDPDVCENGTTESQACGLNGNGTETRTCAAGQWGAYGTCVDSDVCTNGATESQVCGLNNNGTQTRVCTAGTWGAYGTCVDPDVCENGTTEDQACGLNSNGVETRTCAAGQWGVYGTCVDSDVCTNGATESQACGLNNNGTQIRTCTSGQWGSYGTCSDSDTCVEGSTENQVCGLNNNGTQTRTCISGVWGAYGSCVDSDVCENGTTEGQVCGLNGNGTQTRTCAAGQWGAYGSCVDSDVCENGTTEGQVCGLNGNGTETRTCAAGQWGAYGSCVDLDVCENGTTEGQACGLNGNGTETRTCAAGQWGAYGSCVDLDVCENGTTEGQVCGLNGNGTETRTCAAGQWGAYGSCVDSDVCTNTDIKDITVCGNGTQPEVCTDGQWVNDGVCNCDTGWSGAACDTDIDECTEDTDGCAATEYCSNTAGSFTCTACGCDTTFTVGSSTACSDEVGQCDCETGYAGLMCNGCATGYQDNDSDTLCEPTCATAIAAGLNCGSNGACNDSLGEAICLCDTGFSGTLCDECSTGYWGAACTACPGTCDTGDGNGMCNDGDMSATAACYCSENFVEIDQQCVAAVVINEIDPDGDWVELYNHFSSPVSIENWELESLSGDSVTIAPGAIIGANSYYIVTLGMDSADYVSLSDDSATAVMIDEVDFSTTPIAMGKSWGRFPTSHDSGMILDVTTRDGDNKLTIGYCSTQWPDSVTTAAGVATDVIHGQIYIDGVTNGSYTSSINMIQAELCYSDDTTGLSNPICVAAPWGSDEGNNHQYTTTLTVADAGAYKYYYQYSNDGGATWTACNLDSKGGSNNTFDASMIGDLTVTGGSTGIDLTGYKIQLHTNGSALDDPKHTYTLNGEYDHGTYIAIARDGDDVAAWSANFSDPASLDMSTSPTIFETTGGSWAVNGDDDDHIYIFDDNATVIDDLEAPKNKITTRQADGSYVDGAVHHIATGAPASITGYSYPIYIYEMGEATTSIDLVGFSGNYVLVYIP